MEAAGVTGVLASDGTQQLGTAHRGTDPATSVVGPVRRSHDVLKRWLTTDLSGRQLARSTPA